MTFHRQSCNVLESLVVLKMKLSILSVKSHILFMLVVRIMKNSQATSSLVFRVSYFHNIFVPNVLSSRL